MSLLDSKKSLFGPKSNAKTGLLGKKKQPKAREDDAIRALFQNWVSNPTNPHHLKNLADSMVTWEIRARMQLQEKDRESASSPA